MDKHIKFALNKCYDNIIRRNKIYIKKLNINPYLFILI